MFKAATYRLVNGVELIYAFKPLFSLAVDYAASLQPPQDGLRALWKRRELMQIHGIQFVAECPQGGGRRIKTQVAFNLYLYLYFAGMKHL